jgi:hypothetical protein
MTGDAMPQDSGSSSSSGGGSDSGSHDSGSGGTIDASGDAAHDAGTVEAAGGCSGATPYKLTVINALNWCNVSVNGSGFATGNPAPICVGAGTVDVKATAQNTFKLGPWFHTTGDTGSGDKGTISDAGVPTSSTTVTVTNADKCVWICCPSIANPTDCPTGAMDQCL